jgi:hypothetical protein
MPGGYVMNNLLNQIKSKAKQVFNSSSDLIGMIDEYEQYERNEALLTTNFSILEKKIRRKTNGA